MGCDELPSGVGSWKVWDFISVSGSYEGGRRGKLLRGMMRWMFVGCYAMVS